MRDSVVVLVGQSGVCLAMAILVGWGLVTGSPPGIWINIAIVVTAAGCLLVAAIGVIRQRMRAREERIRRGCCRKCGYDIAVTSATVCPECGAKRQP